MTAPENEIWTTADGRRLRVSQMTEEHLANAMGVCERQIGYWLDAPDGIAHYAQADEWSLRLDVLRAEDRRRATGSLRELANMRIEAGLLP